MNISQYLKSVGVTKTELALEIGLSRPTLNQYIRLFEMGQAIDNERYDIIFKRLFSERQESKDLFEKNLEAVKYLLERDRKYDIGNLKPEAADTVAQIHNYMVRDMSRDNWDEKVYDTISLVLTSYRNNVVFRELASYFADLNMDTDLQELSETAKAYHAYFYKCFREILEKPPKYDEEAYEAFVIRKKEILKDREESNNRTAKKVKMMLDKAIKELEAEYQEKGIEATEDVLMTEVIRKINGV